MIDFDLALFSHCERHPQLPVLEGALLDQLIAAVLGAPFLVDRVGTYVQRPVLFLAEEAELRVHAWVRLPLGHPRFDSADRGLVCLVCPIGEQGPYGRAVLEVAWLGAPLPDDLPAPRTWIDQMVVDQGYIDLSDTTWAIEAPEHPTAQLLASMVAQHVQRMTGRRIKEREQGIVLEVFGELDD